MQKFPKFCYSNKHAVNPENSSIDLFETNTRFEKIPNNIFSVNFCLIFKFNDLDSSGALEIFKNIDIENVSTLVTIFKLKISQYFLEDFQGLGVSQKTQSMYPHT